MDLDYAEEHTLAEAARDGSVTAQTCREGERCDEGMAHLQLYEGMVRRGLLHLSRMSGSQFSPKGAEFVEFAPTEAGLAVLNLRRQLLTAEARLESTVDALNGLADRLHASGLRDDHGHPVRNFVELRAADRLLDGLRKTPA